MSNIVLLDANIPPDVLAMLQAYFSRSHRGIEERVEEAGGTDYEKVRAAISKYYANYGHESIGQCGTITMAFEGVSMLFANALQHSPIYNGQESSSRFIPFETTGWHQPFRDGSIEAETLDKCNNAYIQMYQRVQAECYASILSQGHTEAAAKAASFDIARCWLPAGCKTNVSYHAPLSVAQFHMRDLVGFELNEGTGYAMTALTKLHAEYPDVVNQKFLDETADVGVDPPLFDYYSQHNTPIRRHTKGMTWELERGVSAPEAARAMANYGRTGRISSFSPTNNDNMYKGTAVIDYGGFRDLHRHRSLRWTLPLLEMTPICDWYVESIHNHCSPSTVLAGANLLRDSKIIYDNMRHKCRASDLQYMVPLGCMVESVTHGTLDSYLYVGKLRTGQTVHPTVRRTARSLRQSFHLPDSIADAHFRVIADDHVSERRGTQTFQVKADGQNNQEAIRH